MDGAHGVEKTCIVPLAIDTKMEHQYIINDAKELQRLNPDFFRRLLAMTYQEIVDEDLDGGPDRKWSRRYVWRFSFDERSSLYHEDYDLYLYDFVETVCQDPPAFTLGRKYTRKEISNTLGGSEIDFLPTENGEVVCGCFRLEHNPDAPNVVLPGTGVVIERTAKIFCAQEHHVPIFIRCRVNEWEYVGDYKSVRHSTDPVEIAAHHKGSITPLCEVTSVIFLQRKKVKKGQE